jgi:glycosyltransferase involved in cell wall biosynthesis
MIEAMACGTPVVTTRASSLGEIAGDAALTIDPLSVDDLAAGLSAVLTEPARAQTLRERGIARAHSLSWTDAARQTLGVYHEVLNAAH